MTYFIDIADKRNQVLKNILSVNGFETREYNIANLNLIKNGDKLIFAPNKKMQLEYVESFPNNIEIFAGNISVEVQNCFKKKNIIYHNFLNDEIFAIKNAKLTAEGILAIVLEQSDKSIFENQVLILGAGRVGKAIAVLFEKLGVKYSLVSYGKEKFAENYLFSNKNFFKDSFKNEIQSFDIIINTIPAKILEKDVIEKISKNTIFIEVASINTLNLDDVQNFFYILAPALPQRFSCETAGKLMFESIIGKNNF